MTWSTKTEDEWRSVFYQALDKLEDKDFSFVTGPGRSGAIASVYASHYLGVVYKPHKCGNYSNDKKVLVVDTVQYTGATLRKAIRWYERKGLEVVSTYGFNEDKHSLYKMWYEKNA